MRTFCVAVICGVLGSGLYIASAPARVALAVCLAEHFVVGEGDTLAEARDDAHARLPQGAHAVRFEERERNHKWYYKIYYTL